MHHCPPRNHLVTCQRYSPCNARVTCCWQKKAGGLKRKLKDLKTSTTNKAKTARKGKGTTRAKKGAAAPEAENAEDAAEPEEQIPPLQGFWEHDNKMYTAVTTVLDGAELALPEKDERLVYYLSRPAKDAGFYLVVVQKAMKDGHHWIKFFADSARGKVNDITMETHMKRWAYIKEAEESQMPSSPVQSPSPVPSLSPAQALSPAQEHIEQPTTQAK